MRRIRELLAKRDHSDAKQSGVLILLYPGQLQETYRFALIRRPEYEGVHSGQVSLPGGRYEPSDRDLSDTALRETEEEIGVIASSVELLGALSELYIPPSNFMVHPFVGWTDRRPVFIPDHQEVEEVIEADLTDLMDDRKIKKRKIPLRNGLVILAPCFELGGSVVWGATAMILSEFREVVRRSRR